MKKPAISVIAPAYNIASFIGDCIKSILKQSFKDFELIIVDDGSTDDTLKICHEYEKEDSRIKILESNHQGVGAARNLGLANSLGKYIAFIDGDDMVHQRYLEILYHTLLNFNADIVNVGFERKTTVSKDWTESNLGSYKPVVFTADDIYNYMFAGLKCTTVWAMLYKKSLLENHKFDKFSVSEDVEYNSRVYQAVKRYIYIPLPLYFYRDRINSAVTSRFNLSKLDGMRAIEKTYYNILQTNPGYEHYALIRLYKSIISLYYNAPDEYKNDVVRLNEDLKQKTIKKFIHHKKIKPGLKFIFICFLKFPRLYKIFRQFMEWKAKHALSKTKN